MKNPGKRKSDQRERAAGLAFTLPSFLGFCFFVLVPLVWAAVISCREYNVFTGASVFAGLDNYRGILEDKTSITALKNTIWYAVFCTVFNTGIGLVLAVMVNDKLNRKVSVVFRSVYFFPSLVGLTFVAVIWQFFFQTDAGVINYYLGQMGLEKIGWLNTREFSRISVLILDVWKNAGMSMLLILAGLQNVNSQLVEAAGIDGAGGWQRFCKIILPLASPQIFFVLIMNLTGALRIYESAYVLTGGGPGDSSLSLVMLIAEKGFTSFDYGGASALSMLLLLLVGVVTALQFAGSRWWVNYD